MIFALWSYDFNPTPRLEGMVKEYKQALRVSETEREQLQRENQRLQCQEARVTTPPRLMTTPTRSTSPPVPDTPSKDIVLEQEPHGAEFEVSWCVQWSAGIDPVHVSVS